MVTEIDLEEIKRMLRHLHQDIENVKRKMDILEIRTMNIAYLVGSCADGTISAKEIDEAVNLDPDFYSSLDEIYSPIDEVDKLRWEEHMRKEKEHMRKEKEHINA